MYDGPINLIDDRQIAPEGTFQTLGSENLYRIPSHDTLSVLRLRCGLSSDQYLCLLGE
jgi:hypothetical protein